MNKIILIIALAVTILLAFPSSASAQDCTGFVDCLFGFSHRTRIRQESDTRQAEIKARSQEERARIQSQAAAESAEREQRYRSELERIQNERWEDDNQRKIVIKELENAIETLRLANEQELKLLDNQNQQALRTLDNQTQIGLTSIHEVGTTQRWSMQLGALRSLFVVVAGALIIMAIIYYMNNRASAKEQLYISMAKRGELPMQQQIYQIAQTDKMEVIRYE